jgi:hypothetical protein
MQEILTTKMMKNNAHGNQTKCNQIMQNEISHMKLTPKCERDQHQIKTNCKEFAYVCKRGWNNSNGNQVFQHQR